MSENMHIERYGQGEKIIFIHGSGWNTHMWYGQRDYLAKSMEVILIDLPGHGESSGDGCQSVEEYRDAIYSMIKRLDIGQPYIVGHSLGGAIALSLSLAYPDTFKGTVLIGTGAKLKVLPRILEGIIKEKEKTLRDTAKLAFSEKADTALKNQAFDETMRCAAEVIFGDFYACKSFDVMASVSSLSLPTLIVCGIDDALTPSKYSFYLNKAIRGSKLVLVEGAGHMVMMEKPMEVNNAIERFVKNEDAAPG
jgi:pimeloyl-ACP methyl ester carboxylesterase